MLQNSYAKITKDDSKMKLGNLIFDKNIYSELRFPDNKAMQNFTNCWSLVTYYYKKATLNPSGICQKKIHKTHLQRVKSILHKNWFIASSRTKSTILNGCTV